MARSSAAVTGFVDRRDAGRRLAEQLRAFAGREGLVVLGLPRGGVPVAYEVALGLDAPLDVMPVRKLPVPGNEELALGAVAGGGGRVLNSDVIAELGLVPERVEQITAAQLDELARREHLYRGEHPPLDLRGRTAIVVDDGLATGATMRAAVQAVHRLRGEAVAAVPVGARATCDSLASEATEVICLLTPVQFVAVGHWYDDFSATTDAEVRELLDAARQR